MGEESRSRLIYSQGSSNSGSLRFAGTDKVEPALEVCEMEERMQRR